MGTPRGRAVIPRALGCSYFGFNIVSKHSRGTTILLVEQNAKVALKLADYGYVLETGRIVIEGDGATLRQDESIVKAYDVRCTDYH